VASWIIGWAVLIDCTIAVFIDSPQRADVSEIHAAKIALQAIGICARNDVHRDLVKQFGVIGHNHSGNVDRRLHADRMPAV
jgi:hypothetical protein